MARSLEVGATFAIDSDCQKLGLIVLIRIRVQTKLPPGGSLVMLPVSQDRGHPRASGICM